MEIAIGSITAVFVIVMVIALSSRRPQNDGADSAKENNTKDEEVLII